MVDTALNNALVPNPTNHVEEALDVGLRALKAIEEVIAGSCDLQWRYHSSIEKENQNNWHMTTRERK